MSTRATVHFQYDGKTKAIVYRHRDGYPNGLGKTLQRFFDDVSQLEDTRFNDPTYLAAKFVVWQAARYCRSDDLLNFLGIGIMLEDPGDIRYRYLLACDTGERPVVTVEEVL